MDDPGAVRLGDGLAGLEDVADRARRLERALVLEEAAQIDAIEVLHHDERHAVGEAADVVDARDVLALEAHRRPRLAEESLDGAGQDRELGQHQLQGASLEEVDVGRGDDHPHPTAPEHPLDLDTDRRSNRRART